MAKNSRQRLEQRKEEKGESPRRLSLYCIGQLERILGVTRAELKAAAHGRTSLYKPRVLIKPPLPFAKKRPIPKRRNLDNPAKELRRIQKRIYQKLLAPLQLPDYIKGGVRGESTVRNLKFHSRNGSLVTMDVRKWFPSITAEHVHFVWHDVLGCSEKISKLLTELTTINDHLPQGASTSTALANLTLYSIDQPIRKASRRDGVRYSSWVDDLAFSGKNARMMIPVAASTLRYHGFRIARNKLFVMGASQTKTLNGLTHGAQPAIPKDVLSRVRSGIDHLKRGHVLAWKIEKYKLSLAGRINYIMSLNPKKGNALRTQLDALK
jgi:hypothetical protein